MIRNQTILITGGAGFIGSTLASRLIEHNRVRIFDTFDRDALSDLPALKAHPNLTCIRGDVRDTAAVSAAAQGVDRIAHLASIAGVATVRARPTLTMRVALEGTTAVMEAAAQHRVARVVSYSTSEVYGTHAWDVRESEPTPIGSVQEPRWTYACAKIAAEHLAHAYGREMAVPVVTLRPFNVFGPRQVGPGAILLFIRRALANEPIVVHGDGKQVRAWCYVDDMVDATLAALVRDEAVGHAFNIGNPAATVTVRELAERVHRLCGATTPVQFIPRDYADVELRVPDISAARQHLQFTPQVELDDGILRTAAWFREQA